MRQQRYVYLGPSPGAFVKAQTHFFGLGNDRADAGVTVLDIKYRIFVVLGLGEIEIKLNRAFRSTREQVEAYGIGANFVHHFGDAEDGALAFRELDLLARGGSA